MLSQALALAALMAAPAPAKPAEPTRCPIIGARYEAMATPGLTAGFDRISPVSDTLSDLTLFVRSATTKRVLHFFFDAGSARYVSIYSVPSDPAVAGWYQPSDTSPGDGRFGRKALRCTIWQRMRH